MDDRKLDEATIEAVVTRLRMMAEKMRDIYLDETESDWARDEAYGLWRGYKEAAEYVATMKEAR